MTQRERIKRLAKVLDLTPTDGIDIRISIQGGRRRWWITGCVEGDQPLPMTGKCHTVNEALDAAEGWLAPEIDKLEEDHGR